LHLPSLAVGTTVTSGPLTLFPLLLAPDVGVSEPRYLAGPAALADGLIDITEKGDGAVVAELVVRNRASQPVLLIEGEALVGAKQNRVLNVSVLLEAGSTTTIPVSCVEQGRWGGEQQTARSPRHAPSRLRMAKTRSVNRSVRASGRKTSDQGEVWREVEGYLASRSVHSPSAALEDAYEQDSHDLQSIVDALHPAAGQVGLASGYGGQIRSLDLFDSPATLEAYWQALVSGAALDALTVPAGEAPTEDAAKAVLSQLEAAEWERGEATGLGADLRADSDTLTATALEWEGATCHLAAFTMEPGESDPDAVHPARTVRPPIRRNRPRPAG